MELVEGVKEVQICAVSAEKAEMDMVMGMEWVAIPQVAVVRFGCRDGGGGGQDWWQGGMIGGRPVQGWPETMR